MEKPIHDYIEGWYDKDPDRISRGVHPDLVKRSMIPDGNNGFRNITRDGLLAAVQSFGGQKGVERMIDIDILDSSDTIATARLVSNEYVDYLHLGCLDNQWSIINVLWEYKSDTAREMTQELKSALEKPLRDYVEGWYDKDKERIARGVHRDLAKRSMNPESPHGIDHYTLDALLDVVDEYGGANGNQRILEMELLDVGKSIATFKAVSNSYIDYIHLGYWENQWWVINVLWQFK
ncbi:MAG: nuclear transport factor 2 family protein [Spirochaetales bacterium]|nr:nuclear transport factor 2 family protein [Spirochaetales bacterium]